MNPQGSQVVNVQIFSALTNRINAAGSCAELQSVVTDSMASLSAVKHSIDAQLALLAPLLALATPPSANPGAIVTWLTNLIEHFLKPIVAPATTYTTQLAELAAQVASLTAAISEKQAAFPSCSITVPPL